MLPPQELAGRVLVKTKHYPVLDDPTCGTPAMSFRFSSVVLPRVSPPGCNRGYERWGEHLRIHSHDYFSDFL
jgi:hypothetical protein